MKIYKTLVRIFLQENELDAALKFYEKITGKKCDMRFEYEEKKLELASVGSFLLIAGGEEGLRPFKDTSVTCLVDSIDEYYSFLKTQGSEILEDPKVVPTGKNMRVKHNDGLIVEYVEHSSMAK